MKKIWTFTKQHYLTILLSFSIPAVVMIVVYWLIGIYPGSERSILATDSFAQYANFHASFNNVLQGKQSIFYTWSGSLGLNYWALAAYYLNGLFTPLVAFFDNGNMPDALYFLTIIKFGAIGLSFWFFANATFKLNRWLIVGLSVAYALMSYTVGYSEVIMWLDAFVYLPLIVLGIHRVLDQKKPTLLFVSYLLLFLTSFYMGFMIGVFTFLYALIRTILKANQTKWAFPMYLFTSVLAGLASMVTILPTLLDLKNNGENLSSIYTLLTPDTGAWDFVAKSMVGVYDTSQYESMPFIYIGLVPLIFCVYYFLSKHISWKDKLGYGSLFALLIASVYIYPLNLFWHGMHIPNMFLYRFSFLFSFLLILLAGYGLEKFEASESNRLVNGVIGIGGVFLIFMLLSNKKRYDVITMNSLIITFVFLIIYAGIWLFWVSTNKGKKWLPFIVLVLMIGEAGFNAKAMVEGILVDWNYPARSLYTEDYAEIKELVDFSKQQNTSFFRTEKLDGETTNKSFNFGYHGVEMFSSIRNRNSSQYLNALGFRSNGTNLNIEYMNNTLLADALVGMKYNLAEQDIMKFGYKKIKNAGNYSLYENQYALPLGFMTDNGIYEPEAVKNQTELFNHLAGTSGEFFSFGEATRVSVNNAIVSDDDGVTIGETEPNLPREVTWLVTVPGKSQGYLSLVPKNFSDAMGVKINVSVNGVQRKKGLVNTGQYYNLGYYEKTTTVKVTTTFSDGDNQKLMLFKPDAVFLDTESFSSAVEKIRENGIDMQTTGRRATAEVSLVKDQVLLTTIPYDRGWKVLIDGEKANVTAFKEAFLSVQVPAGKHQIEFVFLPQGFVIGASIFGSCLFLFSGYLWWLNRQQRLARKHQEKNSLEQIDE
nr:YfhO family protein [Enterococcus crotali]